MSRIITKDQVKFLLEVKGPLDPVPEKRPEKPRSTEVAKSIKRGETRWRAREVQKKSEKRLIPFPDELETEIKQVAANSISKVMDVDMKKVEDLHSPAIVLYADLIRHYGWKDFPHRKEILEHSDVILASEASPEIIEASKKWVKGFVQAIEQ